MDNEIQIIKQVRADLEPVMQRLEQGAAEIQAVIQDLRRIDRNKLKDRSYLTADDRDWIVHVVLSSIVRLKKVVGMENPEQLQGVRENKAPTLTLVKRKA